MNIMASGPAVLQASGRWAFNSKSYQSLYRPRSKPTNASPPRSIWTTRRINEERKGDKTVRLGFGDSGIGGLIFMLMAANHSNNALLELCSRYKLCLELIHLGDGHNAPYGPKSEDNIQKMTKAFVSHLSHPLECQIVTIACNTASTTVDGSFDKWFKTRFRNRELIPILRPTAEALYAEARFVSDSRGVQSKHIVVLATPATTKSEQFPKLLANIHSKSFPYGSYTVVVNSDSRLEKWSAGLHPIRVFQGKTPLTPGDKNEAEILDSIRSGRTDRPVLVVHVHAPENWVSIMEGRVAKSIEIEVDNEMGLLAEQIHQFSGYTGYHTRSEMLAQISAVGLCCTHYPFLDNLIKQSMWQRGMTNIKTLSQGEILADKVIVPYLSSMVQRYVEERPIPIPVSKIPPFKLLSYTTSDGSPSDSAAFDMLKKVATIIDPQQSKLVDFNTIKPLDYLKWEHHNDNKVK